MRTEGPTLRAERLGWACDPADVVASWPGDRGLLALVSGAGDGPAEGGRARSRWSILTEPGEERVRFGDAPKGRPEDAQAALAALDLLDRRTAQTRIAAAADLPPGFPFASGWIGWLAYELGWCIEPSAAPTDWPDRAHGSLGLGWFARCEAAYVHDAADGSWWVAGAGDAGARLPGFGPGGPARGSGAAAAGAGFEASKPRSVSGEPAYREAVARTVERIRAGEVFQANIAHHLRSTFRGGARGLFLALARAAAPEFGAYLEWGKGPKRRAIASVSPELFLAADLAPGGSRAVTTRPIKGTREVGGREAESGERALLASDKDAAELHMITDLMRNDLGRVCEFGSVRVEDPRAVERHAGGSLLHTVAVVSGRLREGVGAGALVRATFPPGSVTGAPKVQAMRVIADMEPAARGAYCGAIGFFADHGPARLSVAIRTASVAGVAAKGERAADRMTGTLTYPVGAGIVADSDPGAEWRETMAKAGALRRALGSARGAREAGALAGELEE